MGKPWISELRNVFFKTNINLADIEAAIKLKHSNIPSKLYKYREINEYSIKNLKENTVWCSNASDFNDPYDSSICFDSINLYKSPIDKEINNKEFNDLDIPLEVFNGIKTSNDPYRTILQNVQKMTNHKITSKEEDQYYHIIKDFLEKNTKEMNLEFNKGLQNGYKICSFSERIDSMLMWSHYSNYHKGFALEYNFQILPIDDVRNRFMWPVIYDSKLFDATAYFEEQRNNEQFNNLFGIIASIHKAKDWEYENEWRLIVPLSPTDSPLSYNVPKPTGIYLGSKISNENQDEIELIAKNNNIDLYKMELSHNSFEMIPKRITL